MLFIVEHYFFTSTSVDVKMMFLLLLAAYRKFRTNKGVCPLLYSLLTQLTPCTKNFEKIEPTISQLKNCMILIEFQKVDVSVPLNLEENRPPYGRFEFWQTTTSVIDLVHSPSIIPHKVMRILGGRLREPRLRASLREHPFLLAKRPSGAPNDNFRKNICSEGDLRSRIFETFVVKFLVCLPLLGFSNM